MSEMVERVARALIESGGSTPWEEMDNPNSDAPTWYRDHYFRMARAAIEAMREPPKEMINAALTSGIGDDEADGHALAWRAMIDEALGKV